MTILPLSHCSPRQSFLGLMTSSDHAYLRRLFKAAPGRRVGIIDSGVGEEDFQLDNRREEMSEEEIEKQLWTNLDCLNRVVSMKYWVMKASVGLGWF